MNEPVNSVFKFDKCPEIGNIANSAFDGHADAVFTGGGLPRVRLKLAHTETDAAVFGINAEHLNFDFFALLIHLFRAF